MGEKFLDKAYDLETPEQTRALYDQWAASYDAEVGENGYATPGRCAAALLKYLPDTTTPILDFGCGTGLSGLALKLAGYSTIDGLDPSPEMLEGARAKGLYRNLTQLDVADESPVPPGSYKAIAAIGVIGVGAAPLSTFDKLMRLLPKGGFMVFSYNDHALADPAFEAKINEWVDCAAARLRCREYGDHLPAQNIKSNVYVIEKN